MDRYSSPQFLRQGTEGVRSVILPGKFSDPDPSAVYRKSIHEMTPIHIISASSRVWVWICDSNNRWVKSHVTRQLPSGCIDVDVGEHVIFQAKVSTNLSSIFPPDLLFLVLSCSLIFLACSTHFCSNHTPVEDPSNANRGATRLQNSTISGRWEHTSVRCGNCCMQCKWSQIAEICSINLMVPSGPQHTGDKHCGL